MILAQVIRITLQSITYYFAKYHRILFLIGNLTKKTKESIRAVSGTRTRDPRLGKPMLYQLSHIGKNFTTSFAIAYAKINDFI